MTTKEKILFAASEEFATKGYHSATIRDICDNAGVYIAAVNYHFSSKETLYEKVFDFLFEKTDEERPGKVNLDIATETEWLDEIKKFIQRMMEKSTSNDKHERYLHSLFAREMLTPSEHFPSIYKRLLFPRMKDIKTLFSYGDIGNEEELDICVFSIISIVLSFSEKQALIAQLTGNKNFASENLDLIVNNIFGGIVANIKYKGNNKENSFER